MTDKHTEKDHRETLVILSPDGKPIATGKAIERITDIDGNVTVRAFSH